MWFAAQAAMMMKLCWFPGGQFGADADTLRVEHAWLMSCLQCRKLKINQETKYHEIDNLQLRLLFWYTLVPNVYMMHSLCGTVKYL